MKKLIALITIGLLSQLSAQERALVDDVTGEVVRYERPAPKPAEVTPNPARWLPVIRQAQPAHDPATQKLEQQVTINPDNVTISWNVVAKTAQEQADYAAQQADAADRQAKGANLSPAAIQTLRDWADAAESTTVTSGNAVATLQTVVDRLGVFFDRFADLIEAEGLERE